MANRPSGEGAGSLAALLRATRLVVGDQDLVIVALPREAAGEVAAAVAWGAGEVLSLSVDRWEASLVVDAGYWRQLAGRFAGARETGPYRLITFDVILPFDVVGFLAAITEKLAAAGVSVYALSAYSRDHILVRKQDLSIALATLEALLADPA